MADRPDDIILIGDRYDCSFRKIIPFSKLFPSELQVTNINRVDGWESDRWLPSGIEREGRNDWKQKERGRGRSELARKESTATIWKPRNGAGATQDAVIAQEEAEAAAAAATVRQWLVVMVVTISNTTQRWGTEAMRGVLRRRTRETTTTTTGG